MHFKPIAAILILATAASLRANPDSDKAFTEGQELLQDHKWDAAADKFKEAVDDQKNYAEAWNKWGQALYNEGNIFEAIVKFKNAIAIDTRYTEAYYNEGMGFENINLDKSLVGDDKTKKKLAASQYDQAIAAYRQALNVSPVTDTLSVIDSHYRLGTVLRDQELKKDPKDQNFKDAIAELETAISMQSDFPECRNELGRTYDIIGRYPEAIEEFTKAIDGDKYFAAAYANRGVAWWHSQNWDNALADCRQAVDIDPRFAGGHYDFAEVVFAHVEVLKANGNVSVVHDEAERAIDQYSMATQIDPNFMPAWLGLAKAYWAYHDFDKAKETYNHILDLDKRNAIAKQALKDIKAEQKTYVSHIPKQYLTRDETVQ